MPQRLGLAERSRRSLPRRGCSAKDDEFLIKPTGFGEPMREALWKLGHKARDDGAAILISTAWAKRWTGYLRANLADVPATISARRSSGARGGLPRGRRHQALVHWELALPLHTELDLERAGLTNIIWATSYAFDFSLVKLPVLDRDGFPIQMGGVTAYPGLYFVGLPWLPTAKSGLLYGVGDNASSIARTILARDRDIGLVSRAA
jgi:hypothetical protein